MRSPHVLILTLLVVLFSILVCLIEARPNPVPNDEVNEKEALERYEREDAQHRESKHKQSLKDEDDGDLDVLDELRPWFGNIPRKNRIYRPRRPDIFQKFLDMGVLSSGDDD